jgi:hypothetical protein
MIIDASCLYFDEFNPFFICLICMLVSVKDTGVLMLFINVYLHFSNQGKEHAVYIPHSFYLKQHHIYMFIVYVFI